ncbi:hypothetical protein [Nocardia heshunensis]
MSRRTGRPRAALRTAATLAVADGLLQALLAGRFLAGNFDALGMHGANTSVLAALTITLLGIVIAWCRTERGPWWPAVAALALVGAEGVQVWFAQLNLLELHVPFGVGIIATLGLLTAWAWQTTGEADELPNSGTVISARSTTPSAPGTASPAQATAPTTHGTASQVQDAAPLHPGAAPSVPGVAWAARGVVR